MTEATFPLDILRAPDDSTIERLVEGWLGPPTVPDFEPVVIGPVPEPLVALHRIAGRWPQLFRQNRLEPISALAVEQDRFVILRENQNVWQLAIDPTELGAADPPVWVHDWFDSPQVEQEPLSRILVGAVLLELVICHAVSSASGPIPDDLGAMAVAPLERLPLAPSMFQTACWAGNDVLAFRELGSGLYLFLAGRTSTALDYLVPIVGEPSDDNLWAGFSGWPEQRFTIEWLPRRRPSIVRRVAQTLRRLVR